MNKIDFNIGLIGEYKIKILNNNIVKYESDWQRNTILSSGLASLYGAEISNLLQYVDFGSSTALSGPAGYYQTGIITQPTQSNYVNISRSSYNINYENLSTVIHYNSYITPTVTSSLTLNEFAIKSNINASAFARNVFANPITLNKNDNLEFVYRLKLNWKSNVQKSLKFKTADNYTYFVPISSSLYQIPYSNATYISGSSLLITKNNEPLPEFGQDYPNPVSYGILNSIYSTFSSVEIGHTINNSTKTYTVSTAYYNISSKVFGVYKDINSIIISKDNTINKTSKYFVARLKFPLALYKIHTEDFTNLNINCECCAPNDVYLVAPSIINYFNFFINYSWSEA